MSDVTIGGRIRAARLAAEFSQQRLADIIGTNVMVVSSWETGARLPSAESLGLLTRALGVSSDYLLGRTDDPTRVMLESDLSADERRILELVRQRDLAALLRVITDVVDDVPEHGGVSVNETTLDEGGSGGGQGTKPRKK